MPDKQIDVPPDAPGDTRRIYVHANILTAIEIEEWMYRQMDIQMYGQTYGHADVPMNPSNVCLTRQNAPKTAPKCKWFILCKGNFLLLKELKNIREPPDHTGNKPTPDIPKGGSGQAKKLKWQIHTICTKHVHHETFLSPKYRKGGIKTYILCLLAHLEIQSNLLLESIYRMNNITVKIVQFFSCSQKRDLHNMAEIEKEVVGFPLMCHVMAGNFT